MVSAGSQCFEFDGEITEVDQGHIILKAKHGDIYIERKYVVFIQYLNQEPNSSPPVPAHIYCPWCNAQHIDVGQWETRPHHKHLCLACDKLFRVEGENGEYFYGIPSQETQELPPKTSQTDAAARFINKRLKHDPINDMLEEKLIPPSQFPDNDDDAEVIKNLTSGQHMWNDTAITRAPDLQQAIKTAMENEEHDFSMGFGSSRYKDPAQTILGMKNGNPKKDRGR